MRRPLFGTGFPVQLNDINPFTIFDTTAVDADPKQVYAVSLYAWQPAAYTSSMLVSVASSGVEVAVGGFNPTVLETLRARGVGPALVADRVLLRGDQQLIVRAGDGGDFPFVQPMWIFGWFERAGESPEKPEYRPLQPTNALVSPFDAPVIAALVPAGGPSVTSDVHQLDVQGRIDVLSLNVLTASIGAAASNGFGNLIFPDGSVLPIAASDSTMAGYPWIPLLDRIPFQAPEGSTGLIRYLTSFDDNQDLLTSINGRFTRG